MDCLYFFEMEGLCKKYGYKAGDLIYYMHPAKSLDDERVLISSNMDVLDMVTCCKGHNTIIIYVIAFGEEENNVQEPKNKRYKLPVKKNGAMEKRNQIIVEEEEPPESPPHDFFWDQVVSEEDNVFEDQGMT